MRRVSLGPIDRFGPLEPSLAMARPSGVALRRWTTACALAATLALALGCSEDGMGSDAAGSNAAGSDETPSQAGGAVDQRVATVYTTLLRYHIAHGLPLGKDQWNGVLYLPSSTREDAFDPLRDYSQPGDQPVPVQVQERVERDLTDVAEVRWVSGPSEAGLLPLDRECWRHLGQMAPALVWLPPVVEGSQVELGISTWAGCGLASGTTYLVSESDGSWTASTAGPMWIT